jgi:hypothetical protein
VAEANAGDAPAAAAALGAALTAGQPHPLFSALVRRLVAESAIETPSLTQPRCCVTPETAFATPPATAVRDLLRTLDGRRRTSHNC